MITVTDRDAMGPAGFVMLYIVDILCGTVSVLAGSALHQVSRCLLETGGSKVLVMCSSAAVIKLGVISRIEFVRNVTVMGHIVWWFIIHIEVIRMDCIVSKKRKKQL
jgi:hypothetical protein